MNQIANIIRRHWLPLLGWNSAILAATIYAVIYASTNIPPVWTAKAQMNLPQPTANLKADLGTFGSVQEGGVSFDVDPLQSHLAILMSSVVLERVRVTDPEKSLYPIPMSYASLFEVSVEPNSTLISLKAQGSSPALAFQRVRTLIAAYQQRLNELRRNDANVRRQFAQEELEKARRDLNLTQTALANFQKSTGITNIEQQTTTLISTINELKTSQANLIAQAQSNATQAQFAAAGLGMAPQQAMNSLRLGENKDYQAIRTKVSEVDTALAEARGKYTEESPQVQSLLLKRQELLRALNQQIAAAIPGANDEQVDTTLGGNGSRDSRIEMISELMKTQILGQGLQQQARQLQKHINKLNAELNSITANKAQLLNLQRRYEIAEGVYKALIAQTEQSKTSPFNVYPNVQTLDEASFDSKSRPKNAVIAFGGMLAAIFGSIALILCFETRNPLLKPKDLQQLEVRVLGSIPRLKHPDMEQNLGADIEIEFQRLASAILMQEHQCLMVASATSGEGKTTVTLGLALALVNFGFRVLVVDGDLRQAQMSRRLGHRQTKSKANAKPTPVPVYPGLDLLPAPSISKDKIAEFFARGSFEQCLRVNQDSGRYDYVLVDSPPVGLASETNLMSAVVCQVLFVVRYGTSDRYPVMDSLEQLTRHNARIIGLVVNGVESQTEGYRYGYGQRELQESEA
jgi:uncharacterized protein involved in exopolysaccharide biosynthesis/Mrp family chromosome partitioning ATPase